MLGIDATWAGGISLHDQALASGLTGSGMYGIDGGNHYSATDPSNTELITTIVHFVASLPQPAGNPGSATAGQGRASA